MPILPCKTQNILLIGNNLVCCLGLQLYLAFMLCHDMTIYGYHIQFLIYSIYHISGFFFNVYSSVICYNTPHQYMVN